MINFKKILLILFCFFLIFFITRFENKKNQKNINIPKQIKIALLLTGSPSNKYSNSYFGYKAFKKLEENYGIDIIYNEYVTSKNIEYLLSDYSHKGYNFIIVQGEELENAILKNSINYPEITFACIEGTKYKNNVASYELKKNDLAFIAGILTASLSQDIQIGLLEFNEIKSYKNKFEEGILAYNNNAKLIYNTIDNLNKDFTNELISFNRNNINTICLFFYSKILEETLLDYNFKGIIIGGFDEKETENNKFIRLNINYNIIYDKIYKNFIENSKGQKIVLSFKDKVFYFEDNGLLNDFNKSIINKFIDNLD